MGGYSSAIKANMMTGRMVLLDQHVILTGQFSISFIMSNITIWLSVFLLSSFICLQMQRNINHYKFILEYSWHKVRYSLKLPRAITDSIITFHEPKICPIEANGKSDPANYLLKNQILKFRGFLFTNICMSRFETLKT